MGLSPAGDQRGLTLVELLVVMVILSVVTTMLVTIFINLQGAYGFTVNSAHAREDARGAMETMVAHIRNAQVPTTGPHAGMSPIVSAAGDSISFYTTHGTAGGTGTPVLVRYRYRYEPAAGIRTLAYQRDTNGNHLIDSGDLEQVLSRDVMDGDPNGDGSQTDRVDLFTYSYFDTGGNLRTTGATYTATGNVATGVAAVPAASLASIVSVNIRLIVDLNPRRAPVYLDLRSTVQPRNLRQE